MSVLLQGLNFMSFSTQKSISLSVGLLLARSSMLLIQDWWKACGFCFSGQRTYRKADGLRCFCLKLEKERRAGQWEKCVLNMCHLGRHWPCLWETEMQTFLTLHVGWSTGVRHGKASHLTVWALPLLWAEGWLCGGLNESQLKEPDHLSCF